MLFVKRNRGHRPDNDIEDRIRTLMQLSKYDKAIPLLRDSIHAVEAGQEREDLSSPRILRLYKYYGECLLNTEKFVPAVDILYKGASICASGQTNPCRETLHETALPAIVKFIKQNNSTEDVSAIVKPISNRYPDTFKSVVLEAFLERAGGFFKNRDFELAAEAYEQVFALAGEDNLLHFDDLIRAGDSLTKSGQLNKAWKVYEKAKASADTFHKQCRVHKKIADLLVVRNQNWHAVYHFLIALQSVPSDRGARTKLKNTLRKLGMEKHTDKFLQLNAKYPDSKQLEISLMSLKKRLKVG